MFVLSTGGGPSISGRGLDAVHGEASATVEVGRPPTTSLIWGAWWAWDPRLAFTLLLYLMFAGYFALRSALREPVERARFGAVIGIMVTILVPFIHLTVYLFNSQHPLPVLARPPCPPGGNPDCQPSLPWVLLRPLLLSFGAFTLLYLGFVMTRYGIGLRRAAQEAADAQ